MSQSEYPKVRGALRSLLAIAGLTLAAPEALSAQSLAVGRFEGEVRAADSRPLGDAEVRVEARQGGATQWTLTSRDGRFRFDALPAGRYDVIVELVGYRPVIHLDVRVGAGFTARLVTTLVSAAPPVSAVDTVPHRVRP